MQWWLTVFFLLGGGWVPGDHIDGWASRAYATRGECEARKRFAEMQTAQHPLDFETRWICSAGRPARNPPPGMLEANWENHPWRIETQWTGPPKSGGLEIYTSKDFPWIAADGVGLRYTGPLLPPLADDLRALLLASPQRFNRVVFELDSNGGELAYVKELVALLQEVRGRMELTTRVMEGSICASGCIPVFMQGKKRKASGASVWVFHGARGPLTNIPNPAATKEYLAILTASGMEAGFLAFLEEDNRIYKPGSLILSGYEVYGLHKAGIITELLPSWRAEDPVLPPGEAPQ
jgi:hypothetical protein